jgi:cellobiose epimerase
MLLDTGNRIEADLRQNILPFWMREAVDPVRRTFFSEVSNDLASKHHGARGALLTCRILWTYAAAYREHGDRDYLQMAELAYEDLLSRFHDKTHGGLYWSIGADEQPLESRKQVYGQGFGIYALTEFYRATRRPEPLETAITIFRHLEADARDRVHGGYFEAFARDWSPIADMRLSKVDLNTPKSQNTLLHVMEAYTNLLRVWPNDALRRAQADLLEVMLTRVLDPNTDHLRLFFSEDWQPQTNRISYGHDIEASWLLTEAGEVLGDAQLLARIHPAAVRIAEATLREGIDTDGAIFNEGDPSGVTDPKREWWPQAEAVVGFLNAAQLTHGDERFIRAAIRAWEFIERRLIDRRHGEWFRCVSRDGVINHDEPKVGFWKCPYHNGRAGLEAPARLRALAGVPIAR